MSIKNLNFVNLGYHTNPVKIMISDELTQKIIGCAYKVYNQLGFGFLESVYHKAMLIELVNNGLKAESEMPLEVYYDDQIVGKFNAE